MFSICFVWLQWVWWYIWFGALQESSCQWCASGFSIAINAPNDKTSRGKSSPSCHSQLDPFEIPQKSKGLFDSLRPFLCLKRFSKTVVQYSTINFSSKIHKVLKIISTNSVFKTINQKQLEMFSYPVLLSSGVLFIAFSVILNGVSFSKFFWSINMIVHMRRVILWCHLH